VNILVTGCLTLLEDILNSLLNGLFVYHILLYSLVVIVLFCVLFFCVNVYWITATGISGHFSTTLTEVFQCFFLSCKANARV
jgi:hypothetical protein